MLASTTHYETLGVPPTAALPEIRGAYRRLAVQLHPDKHGGNPHFEEQFKRVNEAYRTLSDVNRRRRYDDLLVALRARQEAQRQQQRQAGAGTWPVGHRYHYATTRRPATVRERYYQTSARRARFSKRDRRVLLLVLIFVTTAAGALAMWNEARHSARADESYLNGVLNAKRGDWSVALADWSEAIRQQPDYGAAYVRRAEMIATKQHDYASALADYNVALRHLDSPADQVRALTGRGGCLAALGRTAAAHTTYDQALKLDAMYAPARLARGELRLFTLHDFSSAVADFTALLRSATATPAECARAVKMRGLAYLRQGEAAAATHDLVAALTADENDGQAWFLLSRAAEAQELPDMARHYRQEAQRRGYVPPGQMR